MKKVILLLGVATIFFVKSHAQGCSDAGFCSIHSIKNNTTASIKDNKNDVAIGFSFGKGERSTSVYTPYVEYTRNITNQTAVTAKLNFSAITGELANTIGMGDLLFVVGLKIPFNKADIVKNGIHLPMPYQTSLGTTDLVFGLSFTRNEFGATLAWQQPLTGMNGNRFLPGDYPDEPLAAEYLPTNYLERKADALLRLSYNIDLTTKLSIRPSLLTIYHAGNDSYLDNNKMRIEIEKSSGPTLNANIFVDYRLSGTRGLELTLGTPFVVRTNRPDGLTRSFVAALEYKFIF